MIVLPVMSSLAAKRYYRRIFQPIRFLNKRNPLAVSVCIVYYYCHFSSISLKYSAKAIMNINPIPTIPHQTLYSGKEIIDMIKTKQAVKYMVFISQFTVLFPFLTENLSPVIPEQKSLKNDFGTFAENTLTPDTLC